MAQGNEIKGKAFIAWDHNKHPSLVNETQGSNISFGVWVDKNSIDFKVVWLKFVLHYVFGLVAFVRVNSNRLSPLRISLICL